MIRPLLGDLIIAQWVDIMTLSEWQGMDRELGLAACVSVGYVVAQNDRSITLAATYGEAELGDDKDPGTNQKICIPWGTVESWSRLSREDGAEVKRPLVEGTC